MPSENLKIKKGLIMSKIYTFGKKLKLLRKQMGITQAKLAELAGVHEKHISKIEIGSYKPNFETMEKILSALNIDIEDIFKQQISVSENDNPFYTKSIQILNKANEQEIEFYYGILKQIQKGFDFFKN